MTPSWVRAAQAYLGLREIKGELDEPKILEFFRRCGHPEVVHDETAWCAAFVGACLAEVGLKGSGALNARSYQEWGDPVIQFDEHSNPPLGAVVVLSRPGGEAWQGHVGFFMGGNDGQVVLLGGNQGDKVCLASFARDRVVAVRWPAGISQLSAVDPGPVIKLADTHVEQNVSDR